MEENKEIIYMVQIKVGGYRMANFEFDSIDAAARFMGTALYHKIAGEDNVEIVMKAKNYEVNEDE
jgi:hypothetical protein